MQISSTEKLLSWTYRDKTIDIHLPRIVSSVVDELRQRVLVVVTDEKHGDQLHSYSFAGEEIFHRNSPDEGRIYYLTTHPTHGALVVLTLKEAVQGWPDWHYTVGDTGELTRLLPAY